jgi:hypothetical protein
MTTIQIQPLQDRVEAWDNGKKQKWIFKNYPGFVNHYNPELVERIKEEKKKLTQNKTT